MRVKTRQLPRIKDAQREQAAFASRALTVVVIVAALFCLLLGRLIWLMVFQHETYETLSVENHIQNFALQPQRGLIYDRHGELLADNRTAFSISVVTELAGDIEAMLADVAALVDLSDAELTAFRDRAANKHRPLESVPLKIGINAEERAAIEVNRHRLHGVRVTPEIVRYYPFGPLMAHAVGSVRRISSEDLEQLEPARYRGTRFIGKRGVEAFYESSLHGEPGSRSVAVNVHGVEQREVARRKPHAGQSITLHLDSHLQIAASAALGQRRGAVVAIAPNTGGILAMVSYPAYDPNLFVTGMEPAQYAALANSRDAPLLDRAAHGRYAPGSTFKPVVGLAALSLGLVDWERTIVDNGEFRLPNQRRVYRDWSWTPRGGGGQGVVNMRRAIYRSSNVYFYTFAAKMEVDELPDFASQFGYGRVTSLDVEGADAGILPNSDWKRGYKGQPWYPGDTVNMAIGQGDLLATPLQLATVAAVIANRGRLVPPRLLKSSDEYLPEFVHGEVESVEGPRAEDWEELVEAMADVVHRGNEGYRQNGTAWAHIGRDISYRMAGKSGTAQVLEIPQGEEYDESELDEYHRKHAWFIAFAPVEHPQIAVAVLVENGGGGSSVAAPVAREVLDAYMLERDAEEHRAIAQAPRQQTATALRETDA